MKTSVASVTFRRKSVCEVAELARRAGLDAVEWGGDILCAAGKRPSGACGAALYAGKRADRIRLWLVLPGRCRGGFRSRAWKLRFHLDAV